MKDFKKAGVALVSVVVIIIALSALENLTGKAILSTSSGLVKEDRFTEVNVFPKVVKLEKIGGFVLKDKIGVEVIPGSGGTYNKVEFFKEGSSSVACWVKRAEDVLPPEGECESDADCRRQSPYEICFKNECLLGDVNNDGSIDGSDFAEFKKDFVVFKQSGWGESLKRSDFNIDNRLSMADYSIFVRSYRLFNNIK